MTHILQLYTGLRDLIGPLGEILGGVIFGIALGIIGAIRRRKPSIKELFSKDVKFKDKHSQIHELLTELRLVTRSSRALIFQFHNGGIFADGSSMKRFSVTHESVSTGIQSMLLESQDVLVTRYMELVHLLEASPYKIISVESLLDCSLRSALEINNVEYFMVSSLKYNDNLTPMGFVCCHWCDANGLDSIKQEGISEDSLEQVIEATTKNINIHLIHTNRK